MLTKGRGRGNTQPSPRRALSDEQAEEVRNSGLAVRELARCYGVDRQVINKIRKGIHYKTGRARDA
jgi:hypothetical protein